MELVWSAGLEPPGEVRELCTGSMSNCQQYYLEPGRLYHVEVVVKGDPRGPESLYELLRRLLEEYPGVYLSYIAVYRMDNEKSKIVIEVFDPPLGESLVLVEIIAILALVIGIIVAIKVAGLEDAVENVSIGLKYLGEAAEEAAKAFYRYMESHPVLGGLSLSILLIGLGAFLLLRGGER